MSFAGTQFFSLLHLLNTHGVPKFIVEKSLSVINDYQFLWRPSLSCYILFMVSLPCLPKEGQPATCIRYDR